MFASILMGTDVLTCALLKLYIIQFSIFFNINSPISCKITYLTTEIYEITYDQLQV